MDYLTEVGAMAPRFIIKTHWLLLSSVSALCASGGLDFRSQLVANATSIVNRLNSGEVDSILSEFFFPAFYTNQQRAEDKQRIARALTVLMRNFGEIEKFTLTTDPRPIIRIGVGPVSTQYWDSLPNNGVSGGVSFVAFNKRISPGILLFTYYFTEGRFYLRSIEFGVDADRPGARKIIADIAEELNPDPTVNPPGRH